MAHFVDDLRVSTRRPTRVAAEEGEHKICRGIEVEQCAATLEVAGFGLRRPLTILDGCAPLAAPGAFDFDPVLRIQSCGNLLVDGVDPENEGKRQDQACSRLVDCRELVAKPVLDVLRVNAVIHDLERPIKARRKRT